MSRQSLGSLGDFSRFGEGREKGDQKGKAGIRKSQLNGIGVKYKTSRSIFFSFLGELQI